MVSDSVLSAIKFFLAFPVIYTAVYLCYLGINWLVERSVGDHDLD